MFEKMKSYLVYIGLIALLSSILFYPELQGKKLAAHDAVTWYEASKEWKDYHDKGENILWTNRIFSGMPLVTIAGDLSGNLIAKGWSKVTSIFPPNISNIFIVMLCAFCSLLLLKTGRTFAFIFSLTLGFNTWILGSLLASHPTKILSLAFMIPIVAGHIALIRHHNSVSLIAICIGSSLSIGYGHYQIVYYGLIINVIVSAFFLIEALRKKEIVRYIKYSLVVAVFALLGAATNLSSLLITNDYNKETMRGGKTELVKPEANSTGKSGGLDINYAFSWSYSWPELVNFIVPDAMGGSSSYKVSPKKSKLAEAVNPNEKEVELPMYWGIQPFAEANYLGAALCFILIFVFLYWRDKIKYLFLALFVLSVFMGLGRSFLGFNEILFDYLPLYNKFRTPTMSFSILTIVSSLFAAYGLSFILKDEIDINRMIKTLKISAGIFIAILSIGFLSVSAEGYTGAQDAQYFANNQGALDLIKADREGFFKKDIFRAIFIGAITTLLFFFYIQRKLSIKAFSICLGILLTLDLYTIHLRYHDYGVFQKVDNPEDLIPNEPYNQYLEQDKSHFRVFNTASQGTFSSNTDGYRFSNVGGYSAAKLFRYQDLIDVHLSKGNFAVLNMLNTKYLIVDNQGQKIPQQNPEACGNAWFIKEVKFAKNANEEMDSIGTFNPKNTVWIDQRYKSETNFGINSDPNASISLTKYHPDNMEYNSSSTTGGFVVFSEIWYKGNEDWNLYVNGKPQKLVRVNYLLRGAYIPAGNNSVEMKFTVGKLKKYRMIGYFASSLILVLIFWILYRHKSL